MTATLAVTSYKGGAGKSSVTANLAGALAAAGQRVLVVDCDPQGAAGAALGVDPAKPTTYEVLHGLADVTAAIRPTDVTSHVEVLPADLDLAAVERDLALTPGWQARLGDVLHPVLDGYDLALVDTAPGLGALPVLALTAASALLVVVRPGFLDLRGLHQAVTVAAQQKRPILGVVVNGVGRDTLHQRDALAAVADVAGTQLLDPPIPLRVSIADAAAAGLPVAGYAPTSDAARAFAELAEEVSARARSTS